MSAPAQNVQLTEATTPAPVKQTEFESKPSQPTVAKQEIRSVQDVYGTAKEKRLAEFVMEMEAKKLANSAFGRQKETNALIEDLQQESEKVCLRH